MLKAQKSRTRSSSLMLLTGTCFAIALTASRSPLAADRDGDRDDRGGRRCRGGISEAGADPSGFPQPQVRRSNHGLLRTTLHACIATNTIVDQPTGETRQINTTTFEGTIPGPTLSVKPGDRLSLLILNDLPPNPPGERGNFFPHDEYELNIHTHGLIVSPLGSSDNIFRHMDPGTAHLMEVKIPEDHPTGTFWFHPHVHGTVKYQFLGGMAGFLIVRGGPGTLDAVPEVAAGKDVVMAFQVIRTTHDGNTVFVQEKSEQFGTFPFVNPETGFVPPIANQGIWSTYGLDGGPPLAPNGSYPGQQTFFYYTTNGVTNPTLHMRPGEVQRWRLLNSTDSDNFLLTLQGHGLNVIAMDGITVDRMYRLKPGDPLVMGPGQRIDVLVKAGAPGTYTLDTQDQESEGSVSPFRSAQYPDGIALSRRVSLHSADFPGPCSTVPNPAIEPPCPEGQPKPLSPFSYPITLATIQVDGPPVDMKLPTGSLPVPPGLPSVETMLSLTPDAVRHVAFENCGNRPGTSQGPELRPSAQLPSCGWYFAKYGPGYWGDLPFNDLLMLRDADDVGQPNPGSETMPRISFKKEGLFDPTEPLFPDMIAGNYEEWTVINRSFTDHPFHIHQNHFLVTKINGIPLPRPEWHDTFLVPSAIAPNSPTGRPLGPYEPPYNQPVVNINDAEFGSITFRIYFNPVTVGCFVVHCHALNHEDIGMMQRLDILPAKGQPSGCMLDSDNAAVPIIDRLFAGRGKFQICRAAVRQSKPIPDGPSASASLSNPLADTAQ